MAFTWRRDDAVVPAGITPAGAGAPGATQVPADAARTRQVADLLVGFWSYLTDHSPSQPALADAIADLQSAVEAYRAGRLDAAMTGVRRTAAAIERVRRTVPTLPAP